jgi:hypothetical protein
MRTIRQSVFETNSSTTHCVTYTKKYKDIDEIPLRDKSEFPALNANGELEVELNIYWDMDVRERDDIDLNSVDTIIKYLTAHAVFSCHETLWSRKNQETIDHFDENHQELLKDIQYAYKTMGLEVPVDIKPYFLDKDDNKIFVTKDNVYKWHTVYGANDWYSSKKEWQKAIDERIKRNPDAANWPYAKYYIGICGNDLSSYSYASATHYFEDMTNGYNWDWDSEKNEDDQLEITTHDILTKQISLSFYHT